MAAREEMRNLEEDYYDSDDSDDSDDPDMYLGGKRMGRKLIHMYHKQVTESEGFDITLDLELGKPIWAPIIPRRGIENREDFVELSKLAVTKFNEEKGANYEFVENVTVNTSCASGMWCYITFTAKDEELKTFQAIVWDGIDGTKDVDFCRFKGDKRTSDSDGGKKGDKRTSNSDGGKKGDKRTSNSNGGKKGDKRTSDSSGGKKGDKRTSDSNGGKKGGKRESSQKRKGGKKERS